MKWNTYGLSATALELENAGLETEAEAAGKRRRYMVEKTVIWRSSRRKSFCTVVDDDDMLSSSPFLLAALTKASTHRSWLTYLASQESSKIQGYWD